MTKPSATGPSSDEGPPPSSAANWLVCPWTASALEKIQPVLARLSAAEDLQLQLIARELVERGGKRLRPALVFLSSRFGQCDEDRLLRVAAALELLHVASLYHDDVIDRAPLRRRAESVNARWGNTLASLGGTYLFARASAVLASLADDVNRLTGDAMVTLCDGEVQEVSNAYDLDLSEREHLAILARKTGTLFALPCRVGAALGEVGAPVADALAVYGRNLGLAFQLIDDALDVTGAAAETGKAEGTDLREGVYGLSLLRALQRRDAAARQIRATLEQISLSEGEVQRVLSLVRESGVVESVLQTAREFAAQARRALDILPAGEAKESLDRLTAYAVSRST
jgi:Geranylgeranyl pyrophosphate synthase